MTCFFEEFTEPVTTSKGKAILYFGLAGFFFGAAVSVKWTGIYAGIGLFIIYCFAIRKFMVKYRKVPVKLLLWSPLLFVIVPVLVYAGASFKEILPLRNTHELIIGYANFMYSQISMFAYHSKLTATHSFASPWYEWILDIKPLWMYQASNLPADKAGTIATLINPVLAWGGLASLIYIICKCFRDKAAIKNTAAVVILSGFFAQTAPWIFVSRVTFIYHYFPIIPFIAIAVGYYINENIVKKGKRLTAPVIYSSLTVLFFIMYYPALTGQIMPKDYIDLLKILPKWIF
jgi:dolichyl-phosphate-mannose--protein O-mannosyl transferase